MPLRPNFRTIFSLLFFATINTGIAQAQVIPDGTLPSVVEKLGNMDKITGGERVGNNLFHSFEEFSIKEGMEAIFENALDIENIFARITGSEISLIEGLLKTSGGANLFLMNPNGIVFGENAQLDVGGSFIATTGNSIEFADGNTFTVLGDNPNVSISVTLPVGVNFNGGNGSITVNGSGNQITPSFSSRPTKVADNEFGLSVNPGKTLALIGDGITLNGGTIVAEGGVVELGSIESGSLSLEETAGRFSFNYNNLGNYKNINLANLSLINTSGKGNGAISLSGSKIAISATNLRRDSRQGKSFALG